MAIRLPSFTVANSPHISEEFRAYLNNIVAQLPFPVPPTEGTGDTDLDPLFLHSWYQGRKNAPLTVSLPPQPFAPTFLWQETQNTPSRIIIENGGPYLGRHHIASWENAIAYVHRFYRSDLRRFHNHPFPWSFSVMLHGAYEEHFVDELITSNTTERVRMAGDVAALMGNYDFHRVELLEKEVWTLFICSTAYTTRWGWISQTDETMPAHYGEGDVSLGQLQPATMAFGSSAGENWWETAPPASKIRKDMMGETTPPIQQ